MATIAPRNSSPSLRLRRLHATQQGIEYLEPLPEVVLLDSRLGGENNRRYRSFGHRSPVRPVADDHAAVKALVLHHLRPQEISQSTGRRLASTL